MENNERLPSEILQTRNQRFNFSKAYSWQSVYLNFYLIMLQGVDDCRVTVRDAI